MPYADPEVARAKDRERYLRLKGTPEYCAMQRERSRRYRMNHPDRQLEAQRKWREAHPGWWRKTHGTAEAKEYRRAWSAEHRSERRAKVRARYAADPTKFRAYAMAYYTRKIGAEQGPIDLDAIVARDGSRCGVCGKKVALKDRSFDHIVPLSKGGAHRQENLQLTHFVCNARRGPGRIPAQLRMPL